MPTPIPTAETSCSSAQCSCGNQTPSSPCAPDTTQATDTRRLPPWLRRPVGGGRSFMHTRTLLDDLSLSTVCEAAKCPNLGECYTCGTATFMIMGETCTRNCAFCNISPGQPSPLEADEPERLAQAAAAMHLRHVVITSVTRDDLPDGGASHFAATIRAVFAALPDSTVEVLIPDFQGSETGLATVAEAKPSVINHNVETHPALYATVRPQADFAQSLTLLRRVADMGLPAKSGFMVGLGETDEHVRELLGELRIAGCSMVTIGQYLRPSMAHPEVKRYVHPDTFADYARYGRELGIEHMFSDPLVRSSYQAGETLEQLRRQKKNA